MSFGMVSYPPRGRIVLFGGSNDPTPERRDRRWAVLNLTPVDRALRRSAQRAREQLMSSVGGVFWELLGRDDVTVMMRARDFPDDAEASDDAWAIFKSPKPLRTVYAADPDTGAHSWWMMTDDEVVLVAPRVWSPSSRLMVMRSAKAAARALRAWPGFGTYDPAE